MTLYEVVRSIERVATSQPDINMIVPNDIFLLNSISDSKYGVFGWTQGLHATQIDSSSIQFVFTLYYIDRLTNAKSNQLEIQSVGIQTLDNIIRTLDEQGIFVDNTYTFQTFNQRFLDECAGVFTNVTFSVPLSAICPEDAPAADFIGFLTSEGWQLVTADGFDYYVRAI